MWIIYSIVIHLLLLGSIFVIYFRSPVLTGLTPQKFETFSDFEAPAKRLVLIVTDGLRAESFFHKNCKDIPHLKKLMLKEGLVGISRTHVPTESRPGHIALIAGLYEDPSAVTRGWKENPIDFDTVFNRSKHTYAWGANDVLHIFSKLSDGDRNNFFFDSYDHELDFSGTKKTYELDEWVFKKVYQFLNEKGPYLAEEKEMIFFLHLLGLDTAGHVHKPGTKLFLENLHYTEKGIWRIVNRFKQVFNDNRTTFLVTSDHGMTDSGSHGAGDPYETETPFFLWGAGVPNKREKSMQTFLIDDVEIPLYELEQAQFAPLMSAYLGLSVPMNNFGTLPKNFLNVSSDYEAMVVHQNALQLVEQFRILLLNHENGLFSKYLNSFEKLDMEKIMKYEIDIKEYIKQNDFNTAINISHNIMEAALEGIEFYQNYYCNILLCSTALTFLGWILYLIKLLVGKKRASYSLFDIVGLIKIILFLSIAILLYLQKVPVNVSIYFILPFFVWFFLLDSSILSILRNSTSAAYGQIIFLIVVVELLVFSFFDRRLISIGFLLNALLNYQDYLTVKNKKLVLWGVHAFLLACFPLIPTYTKNYNNVFLFTGILTISLRLFIVKCNINPIYKFLCCAGLFNSAICIYCHTHQYKIPIPFQAYSWLHLIYSFSASYIYNINLVKHRLELLIGNFMVLYSFLCTSYESLFILLLTSEIIMSASANYVYSQLPLQNYSFKKSLSSKQLQACLRLAFSILFYTIFSFFGTGNIASVSSFDPNIIRCFLSTFSPFVITFLVILKLLIPIILIISIIFAINSFARFFEREIFIILLIVCDFMGLNFLFFVTNKGSWLDIGSSISHFVIMEVTTVVILILTFISKILLRIDIKAVPGKDQ